MLILFTIFTLLTTFTLFLLLTVQFIYSRVKSKAFPKKNFIATLTGVVLLFSIYIHRVYFFSFDRINDEYTQKGPGPIISPSEKYSVNAYYEPYGGAVGGVNVWVEKTNHEENKTNIVYYADAKSDFSMQWKDEKTLSIINDEPDYPGSDRSITLNIEKEIYHENGWACKSILMKNTYERCYQD
ncbi:DUF5412 family protein [Alkalihalophilus marmarensis]|uniref:Uncharacterized protein n=1 Tax=Alkalihalophilus marmarensis DSM 21297 TaxID=1188261 RepID=U6SQF5_9BACI|nr:DUF5412 family protein [Alkalihalophilus marmarensis]ERN53823.1 hypothetical protein A33I_10105 [Alkalihalophilus marmarensis DSM 21297]